MPKKYQSNLFAQAHKFQFFEKSSLWVSVVRAYTYLTSDALKIVPNSVMFSTVFITIFNASDVNNLTMGF